MFNGKMRRLVVVLSLAFLPLVAECYEEESCGCSGPCFETCCDTNLCLNVCGDLTLSADFLFWKPRLPRLEYGFVNDSNPALNTTSTGRYRNVHQCWEPGVRGHIKKADLWCNGWDLMTCYTYIGSDNSSNGSSTVPFGAQSTLITDLLNNGDPVGPTFIRANNKFKYHAFDILFARDYCCCPCQMLTPFFGITWIRTDSSLNHELFDSNLTTTKHLSARWDGDSWGVGWKMGSNYRYEIYDCLDLNVMGSGSLLAGTHKTNFEQRDLSGTNQAAHTTWQYKSDQCACIPGWHFAINLVYKHCICNCAVDFKVGYECLQWTKMPTPLRLFGNSLTNNFAEAEPINSGTLGFHGLVLGFNIYY